MDFYKLRVEFLGSITSHVHKYKYYGCVSNSITIRVSGISLLDVARLALKSTRLVTNVLDATSSPLVPSEQGWRISVVAGESGTPAKINTRIPSPSLS